MKTLWKRFNEWLCNKYGHNYSNKPVHTTESWMNVYTYHCSRCNHTQVKKFWID
jgi:hypothetical protein